MVRKTITPKRRRKKAVKRKRPQKNWHKEPNHYRYFGKKEYRRLISGVKGSRGVRSVKSDGEEAVRNINKYGMFHGEKKQPATARLIRHPEGVGSGWVIYWRFKDDPNSVSGIRRRRK